jgi:hypothetical protein
MMNDFWVMRVMYFTEFAHLRIEITRQLTKYLIIDQAVVAVHNLYHIQDKARAIPVSTTSTDTHNAPRVTVTTTTNATTKAPPKVPVARPIQKYLHNFPKCQ